MCVDFRQLNASMPDNGYPVKDIPLLLQSLSESKCSFYSMVDITQAFQSIRLTGRAAEKAGIVTPTGSFKMKRLCYGLKNAPALFNAAITRVLDEIPPGPDGQRFVTSYFDNILIHSKTAEEHLQHLQIVFKHLSDAGLKINPSKGKFFKSQLVLLGRVFDKDGFQATEDHVKALRDLPPPMTSKACKDFSAFLVGLHLRSTIIPPASKFSPNYYIRTLRSNGLTNTTRYFSNSKTSFVNAPKCTL